MRNKATKRDTQWDEADTTSGRPLMPDFGNLGSDASPIATDLPEGKCIKEMVQSRVTINKVVEDQPPVRQEDGTIIVSVVKEKMVLVKKMVVVNEIHLEPILEDCEENTPPSATTHQETKQNRRPVGQERNNS